MKLQPFGLNLPGHLGDLDDSSTEDVHVPFASTSRCCNCEASSTHGETRRALDVQENITKTVEQFAYVTTVLRFVNTAIGSSMGDLGRV